VGHKEGTEAEIHARLRELTDQVRRLRAELTESTRVGPGKTERAIALDRGQPKRPQKRDE
jgi:hypothetical protein